MVFFQTPPAIPVGPGFAGGGRGRAGEEVAGARSGIYLCEELAGAVKGFLIRSQRQRGDWRAEVSKAEGEIKRPARVIKRRGVRNC